MFWKRKETENTETYDGKWKKSMLDRWIDLEARVTALEMNDKTYKKQHRRKFDGEETQNSLSGNVILAE